MPAPLPPTPLGTPFYPNRTGIKVVVELFLDVNCPFSRKMYKALTEEGGPVASSYGAVGGEGGGEGKGVQFIFHNVIQVCLAVRSVATPSLFFSFVSALFDRMEAFSDDNTYHKSRAQITEELLSLAESVGVPAQAVKDKVTLTGSNNATTQAIKWGTKFHRSRGVHVTPTVFVNGLEAGEVSSSWSGEQWRDFIDTLLVQAS